jgi:hypothetical protein
MADIVIESLQVTVELDGAGADEHFHRMFERCIERWDRDRCAREADQRFADQERRLPEGGGFR